MEEQKKTPEEQDNNRAENKETKTGKKNKGGIHNNALHAASMGRAATAQVSKHSVRGLADTGTNVVYEGPTAPGGGGSVGSGYASGNSAIESNITTDSDYDRARVEKDNNEDEKGPGENEKQEEERDII